MLQAIVLAIGLAMDATAVAAARGLVRQPRELVVLPLLFGAFQAGLAALGWLLGAWGGHYVEPWDHWIAFGLLVAIGGKMLVEAWRGVDGERAPGGLGLYLLLALATSIDAGAAGITLPLVPVAPWVSIVLIGAVTSVCAVGGYLAGRSLGNRLGAKLEIAGGAILIALGIRILVEHL